MVLAIMWMRRGPGSAGSVTINGRRIDDTPAAFPAVCRVMSETRIVDRSGISSACAVGPQERHVDPIRLCASSADNPKDGMETKMRRSKLARLLTTVGAAAVIVGGAFAVSGAAADTGSAGQPAASVTGVTLWAKVSATGTLLAASGISSVNHFGGGRYNLTTTSDISNCALTGTINTAGGGDPGPGSGSILVGAVNGTTLFVRTATPSAAAPKTVDDDRPFSLAIYC